VKIRPANEQDLIELSGWFLTESEAKTWGGPSIHFPMSLDQLKIDIDWDISHSYALVDGNDNLLGFAQTFDKFGYKHLGGIIVSPKKRGRKLGYKLMAELLNFIATNDVSFSLFVYADNIPAKSLYESIGFEARSYPYGQPEIKDCIFMVKET
jgi:ribosomal-protein-alanine N-acetyltransferase